MSEKKIAVISIYPPKATLHGSTGSGVWSYTKNLMSNMNENTRKNTIILTDYDTEPSSYTEDEMQIERCRRKQWLYRRLSQIINTLKKYPSIKTDHIHHEFNMFGWLITIPVFLILLRKLRSYQTIVTYHGVVDTSIIDTAYGKVNVLPWYFPTLFLRFAFQFFYAATSSQITNVIVHEAYFKNVLIRYGYQDKQVHVIYHGVEDKHLTISREQARSKLWISSDKKVLLYFGFLAGYKGVDLLLDTFETMDKDKYHLILAGGAPKRTLSNPIFRAWYEWINSRTKNMPWVTRIGFVSDEEIPLIYSSADVLIMPYLYMLAASGPMALALSYNLPFLVSESFAPVLTDPLMRFSKTPDGLLSRIQAFFEDSKKIEDTVKVMRSERLRNIISAKTALLYDETLCEKK